MLCEHPEQRVARRERDSSDAACDIHGADEQRRLDHTSLLPI
jgi:hypothetical protein